MWELNKDSQLETVQCPVCKTLLGKREKHKIYSAHCEECKATFYWKPWIEKPSAFLDKMISKKCGCERCGR